MNDIESGGILLDGFKTCLKCIYTENFFFFLHIMGKGWNPSLVLRFIQGSISEISLTFTSGDVLNRQEVRENLHQGNGPQ